jgi:hypothetical protein
VCRVNLRTRNITRCRVVLCPSSLRWTVAPSTLFDVLPLNNGDNANDQSCFGSFCAIGSVNSQQVVLTRTFSFFILSFSQAEPVPF